MSRSSFGQPPTPQVGMKGPTGPMSGPKMAPMQSPMAPPTSVPGAAAGVMRNAIAPQRPQMPTLPMPVKGRATY